MFNSIERIIGSVKKTIYITPCSPTGLILSEAIHNKQGVKSIFLDNNLTPATIAVSLCIKSGYKVMDTNKFVKQSIKDDHTIIVFHTPAIANAIAKQLENNGLMRGKDFIIMTPIPMET
jgi:hypothetical protein